MFVSRDLVSSVAERLAVWFARGAIRTALFGTMTSHMMDRSTPRRDIAPRIGAAFVSSVLVFLSLAGSSLGADTVAISGRIYDEVKGKPLAATPVVIYDPAGSVRHLVSDSEGRYRAIGIGSGLVRTWVYRQGYLDGRQECTVRPGDSLRLDFGLISQMHIIWTQHFNCEIEPDPIDRNTVR